MDSSSDSENDSDKELQVAFAKGQLKGRIAVEGEAKKSFINNVGALKEMVQEIKSDLPWIEHLDLTVHPIRPPNPLQEQLGADPDDLSGDEIHNDVKREMKFHRQAQAAVLEGIPRLHKLNIPTKRPDDYFAEMVKSDEHMKKLRENLLSKQQSIERSEKAKKLRAMRKFGKQVQQEVSSRRQKEKKEMIEAVKKFRKGKTKSLDFLEEQKNVRNNKSQTSAEQKQQQFQPNKRRQFKNEKFGFGGQKKRSKQNTKQSTDDVSSFSVRRNAALPQKHKKRKQGKKNRPGKSRRKLMNKNKPRR